MINEIQVLAVVAKITPATAYFFNGSLVVETADSAIATKVFDAIWEKITPCIAFSKVGNETIVDFI